jgi:hypothetical protein
VTEELIVDVIGHCETSRGQDKGKVKSETMGAVGRTWKKEGLLCFLIPNFKPDQPRNWRGETSDNKFVVNDRARLTNEFWMEPCCECPDMAFHQGIWVLLNSLNRLAPSCQCSSSSKNSTGYCPYCIADTGHEPGSTM